MTQLPEDSREVVRGMQTDGTLIFGQVDVAELSTQTRFGAKATSTSQNTVSIGDKTFTLDQVDLFRVGDDVQITCLDEPTCNMWGEIIARTTTTSPANVRVYIDDISPTTITSGNWELQIVGRPKPGIEKDTSTTSINPTTAGPFTFTVSSGKFFPIGGKLLLKPTTDRTIALIGLVKAYSGTTLVVEKNTTNATVSTSYSSWSVALLDAPQNKIRKYEFNGLRVTQNAFDWKDIDISSGACRDTTDTVDIVLSTGVTKQLDATFVAGTNQGAYTQSANLTGTLTIAAGGAITGVGTLFTTEPGSAPVNTDLEDQAAQEFVVSIPGMLPMITAGAVTDAALFSTNTVGVCETNTTAVASTTYKRGGWPTAAAGNGYYVICVAVKDSDGSVAVFASSFRASGGVDLPTGYTYYRPIAALIASKIDSALTIYQPFVSIDAPFSSQVLDFVPTGRNFATGSTVLDNISALDQGLTNLSNTVAATTISTGSYTPTITDLTNVAASTPGVLNYYQVDDMVTVFGDITFDPTAAAGTATIARITLPIASIFTATRHCSGFLMPSTSGGTFEMGVVTTDVAAAPSRAELRWNANNLNNHPFKIHFSYKVV
jgi:hypothetical protein